METDPLKECLVKKKGDYIPPRARDSFLQFVITRLKNWSDTINTQPKGSDYTSNISWMENKALQRLCNNDNLVITKVDKGGSLVIMDKNYYKQKIETNLKEQDTYEKLPNYKEHKVMKKVEAFTKDWTNVLDKKERLYLTKFDKKTANFFASPKVHKSNYIKTAIENCRSNYIKLPYELVDLDFRYIQGGWASATCKLSELLDILLKPFLPSIPAYLKDTTDFLTKLPYVNPGEIDDILLVTCDVSSMYTNIKLDRVLQAITYWLNQHPDLLHKRFPASFVLEGLTLVLQNSTFSFNDEAYRLKVGTATGTTVAPTYANLVMGFLETNLYNLILEKFGGEVYFYVKKNWLRFLDDGFILWKKSFGDISDFINILNSLDENLNFTHEVNTEKIAFLNVLIYKEKGTIQTDMYYKPTDSHDYLPFESYHPRHVKDNIPYTLARMICTIVSDPIRREFRLQELTGWLKKSDYPDNPINRALNSLKGKDVNELRTKTPKVDKEQLIFVESNNPNNPQVFQKILDFINFLKTDPKYDSLLKNIEIIKSQKQTLNLEKLLKRSYFGTEKFIFGSHKCGSCSSCKFIEERGSVYFHRADPPVDFEIKHNFNCDSGYLIYKLTCAKCEDYYIGHTTNFRDRVQSHKFCIENQNYRNLKVHKHIFECAGDLNIPFKMTPFFKVKRETLTALLTTEDYFIDKMHPLLNST